MKTMEKKPVAISPLMQKRNARAYAMRRLAGSLSKARAREWVRHVGKTRREWK